MAKIPKWQLASLRRIQWRVAWVLILAYIVTIGLALLLQAVDKKPMPSFVMTLPLLLVLIFGVNMAYLRGVRDGKAHSSDSDQDHESI